MESGEGIKCDCANVNGPIIGGPFTLVDTEKQVVTEQDFKGKWVLMYFGYTSSPDIGPEQVQVMAKAIDTLGLILSLAVNSKQHFQLSQTQLFMVCISNMCYLD